MNFYGLFGYPLGHSLSPVIHQIIYDKLSIEAAYKLFEVEENNFEAAIDAMRVLDISGANVTVPYKKKVIPLLDDVSEAASTLQAVNTIKNTKGRLVGYNTDYAGVGRTFQRQGWQVDGQLAYVLGTGGASQAVSHYLSDHGAQVILVSRQPEENPYFKEISYDELKDVRGDILANTTPVGMVPNIHESPVEEDVVDHFDIIFDATYGKEDNRLISMAKQLNKECTDGLQMLVGQAIAAVELWEDIQIDDAVMDDILSHFAEEWKE